MIEPGVGRKLARGSVMLSGCITAFVCLVAVGWWLCNLAPTWVQWAAFATFLAVAFAYVAYQWGEEFDDGE